MNMSSSTPPPPPPPRRNMRLISLTEIYESQGIDLTQIFSIQDILEQGRLRYVREYNKLSEKEKNDYQEFLELGSICPICKSKNHESFLKRFYFSKNQRNITIKNMLLKIMEQTKGMSYKLSLGIPCCKCYRKVFNVNRNNLNGQARRIELRNGLIRILERRNR